MHRTFPRDHEGANYLGRGGRRDPAGERGEGRDGAIAVGKRHVVATFRPFDYEILRRRVLPAVTRATPRRDAFCKMTLMKADKQRDDSAAAIVLDTRLSRERALGNCTNSGAQILAPALPSLAFCN